MIVLNTVRNFEVILSQELYIAMLLAKQGNEVTVLLDDGQMEHWDSAQFYQIQNNQIELENLNPYRNKGIMDRFKRLYLKFLTKTIENEKIKILKYSEILKAIDRTDFKVVSTDLEKYAMSSTKRFFQNSIIDLNDGNQRYYYELSIKNAEKSTRIGLYIVEKLKPDIFLTSHGIYSTWGPAFDYVKKQGIKSKIHAMHSFQRDAHSIMSEKPSLYGYSKEWLEFKKKELKEKDKVKIRDYLIKRTEHKASDTKVYYQKYETINLDKQKTKFKKIIIAFPNVCWDGDIKERNRFFDGIVEWLEYTIDLMKKEEDKLLIIRFHPSESTMMKKAKKLSEILFERNPKLKAESNIMLIPSDKYVDSYNLVKKYADLALVYNGTLGIELPFLGIPTISASYNNFTGIPIEPETKEGYSRLLQNIDETIASFKIKVQQKDWQELIIKKAYWYFFETRNYFPIKTIPENYVNPVIDWKKAYEAGICIENNKKLRRTYHNLVN